VKFVAFGAVAAIEKHKSILPWGVVVSHIGVGRSLTQCGKTTLKEEI